ncbi:hypothetical protein [Tateyamaria sp. Alg231-49]|uniref:hypothetical protein n=1 Tax=Tateyamaria sp. Alg231-49 TaxID=1922219 RepID=UPI000D55D5B6|nr:hypothetical protein [Tateyamaria sp. Alg231-49]
MWFDARAKLAEITGHPPATSATTATQTPPVSRVSQAPMAENHSFVAKVAIVATPSAPSTEPDGVFVGGRALTWTGRVVSLADWRNLTGWEKHGPDGRHWNGITRQWEQPEGAKS